VSIWKSNPTIEQINEHCKDTMVEHLNIEISKVNEGSLEGIMPVSNNIKQPFGIVHGGANCVLAETLGSLAANLVLDNQKQHAVGLSIHTNHIKAVRNGHIRGVAKPKHLGSKTQVWEIETFNTKSEVTSITSLTMSNIDRL
jgi:1,4-dihydroxy-2-naphthoyl-CoA hydrolase